ncbi:MAG: hypothetical protein WAZ18_06600 [Alphaproteobacteria bacterium]
MKTETKVNLINRASRYGTFIGNLTAEFLSERDSCTGGNLHNIDGHVFLMTENGLEEQHVPDVR